MPERRLEIASGLSESGFAKCFDRSNPVRLELNIDKRVNYSILA